MDIELKQNEDVMRTGSIRVPDALRNIRNNLETVLGVLLDVVLHLVDGLKVGFLILYF